MHCTIMIMLIKELVIARLRSFTVSSNNISLIQAVAQNHHARLSMAGHNDVQDLCVALNRLFQNRYAFGRIPGAGKRYSQSLAPRENK